MISIQSCTITCVLIWLLEPVVTISEPVDTDSLKHIANVSYAVDDNLSALATIFNPRMDFDQWKPLTGRGDPLRNDPTYDYKPPMLERVHYWAEDTRLEREHYPERKSEVLMLGVSSRRPSVASRVPSRIHHRPPHTKYEDFSYRINHHYPMTILVPPPPPPPGHKPPLFILKETKNSIPVTLVKFPDPPIVASKDYTTPASDTQSSIYDLQESNLVYQASTTNNNWIDGQKQTKPVSNAISSDYAGWGPTTPLNIDFINDTHNLISNDHFELSKHVYKFYKPMLSEAPPPPPATTDTIFLPTVLPATEEPVTPVVTESTYEDYEMTTEIYSNSENDAMAPSTVKHILNKVTPTVAPPKVKQNLKKGTNDIQIKQHVFDMLGPMMSMPLVNGPERLEDNLYAHASENIQVFNEKPTEDSEMFATLQTMQPPPPAINVEVTTEPEQYPVHHYKGKNENYKKPSKFTHDPYLHMRFTTPSSLSQNNDNEYKSTSEEPSVPMYLIIQGHSKVKTYSSKPNINVENDIISNEISKPKETTEVKHLHPIKKNKIETPKINRESRSKNLRSLVESNIGSIEIQETDIGVKYDVSDGSNVPVEIYRRGIVETDENDYSSAKRQKNVNRKKRQIDLEDLLPFDEETIENYVYNYFNDNRNSTGITGLIAQAITSDTASEVDDLEDDLDDNERDREVR